MIINIELKAIDLSDKELYLPTILVISLEMLKEQCRYLCDYNKGN
jgi:hypothetical protein